MAMSGIIAVRTAEQFVDLPRHAALGKSRHLSGESGGFPLLRSGTEGYSKPVSAGPVWTYVSRRK